MRYDLTDFEWSVIEPLLPRNRPGPKRVDDRRVLNGIFSGSSLGCATARSAGALPNPRLVCAIVSQTHYQTILLTGLNLSAEILRLSVIMKRTRQNAIEGAGSVQIQDLFGRVVPETHSVCDRGEFGCAQRRGLRLRQHLIEYGEQKISASQ